jgi:hypothetical protein
VLELDEKMSQLTTPGWLSEIFNNRILPAKLPFLSILENSCFYPASGLDITPIALVAGNMFSFVYCDYSISRKDFLEFVLNQICGYSLVLGRFINEEELPHQISTKYDDELGFHGLMFDQSNREYLGHWSIWEQAKESSSDKEQRNIISLLFLAREGIACYKALYLRNQISLHMLSINPVGYNLGGAWIDVFDPDEPFWKTVKEGILPDKLLIGQYRKIYSWEERYLDRQPLAISNTDELDGDYLFIGSALIDIDSSTRKLFTFFKLDKRTNEQKEQDRLELEKKRKQEDEKRKCEENARQQKELEKQLEKQLVNSIRASNNMFGALRRRDYIAISALMKRGADIYYKNGDGLSIVEYAQQLGIENLFNK